LFSKDFFCTFGPVHSEQNKPECLQHHRNPFDAEGKCTAQVLAFTDSAEMGNPIPVAPVAIETVPAWLFPAFDSRDPKSAAPLVKKHLAEFDRMLVKSGSIQV